MAEIRIERKPRRSIWPWILGLIVAALLVWGLVATMNNDRDDFDAQARQSSLAPAVHLEPLAREPLARAA